MNDESSLLPVLLRLPVFRSEWVLYLLLGTSLVSVAIVFERWVFYRRRRFDANAAAASLERLLPSAELAAAARLFQASISLEALVLRAGLEKAQKGAEVALETMLGVLGRERQRYEQRLDALATIASNAPYVGLFGTVLGIVRAFRDVAAQSAEASAAVMAGMAEALIATALGLLVAIPALVAFNVFKGRSRGAVANGQRLMRLLLSELKGAERPLPAE
jgi:biopolymer transport protein ExbB/TolQ